LPFLRDKEKSMKTHILTIASLAGLLMASCGGSKKETPPAASYFDIAGMDTTARAADNFYQYANGQWR
jgi:predicted metalloendopeptidase